MKNFKKITLGLLVGALAIGFSSFTNAKTSSTTWHISNNTSGIYTVTSDGECDAGSSPCQFTTNLPPDQPGGKYSQSYLTAHNVPVEEGTFSN
jgi:hypothetical protein